MKNRNNKIVFGFLQRISTSLILFVSVLALASAMLIAAVGYSLTERSLMETARKELAALSHFQTQFVVNSLLQSEQVILSLANNHNVSQRMIDFAESYDSLRHDGLDPETYLQGVYIDDNPYPFLERHKLNRGSGPYRYHGVHEATHGWIEQIRKHNLYYDIFLINPEGRIVYSVQKESDFATSLVDGIWKDTNFARAFRRVDRNRRPNQIVFEDFEFYTPSQRTPAAFMAAPIIRNQEYLGVIALQIPLKRLTSILTQRAGMGRTGEVLLVGDDFLMRSHSSFNVNDKALRTEIRTPYVERGLSGEEGFVEYENHRGKPSLIHFTSLDYDRVNWAVITEKNITDVLTSAQTIKDNLIIGLLLSFILVATAGFFFSRRIASPIGRLSRTMQAIANGNLDEDIRDKDRKDEVGEMARAVQFFKHSEEARRRLETARTQDQQALRDSESRLRTLFEYAPDAIVVFNLSNDMMIDVNSKAEKLFGHTMERLLDMPFAQLYPKEQPNGQVSDTTFRHYLKQAHEGSNPTFEWTFRHATGRDFSCEIHLVSLPSDEAPLVRASVMDISLRKRAERILQETNIRLTRTQQRLRSIFEAVGDGIILVNEAGIIEAFNPAAEDIFGISSAESIGKDIKTLIPMSMQQDVIDQASVSRRITGKHQDGHEIPLAINVSRMEIEGRLYFTGVIRDITEQLERENALTESNRHLELAEEVSLLGHWYLDLSSRKTTWSDQVYQIHGVTDSEFIPDAQSMFNFMVKEDREPSRDAIDKAIKNLDRFRFEARIEDKYGVTRHLYYIGHVEANNEGVAKTIFGVVQDFTERKQIELDLSSAREEAETATKAKSEFLANMSHEIRTPMNAIINLTQLCLKTVLDSQQKDYLKKVYSASTGLLHIINDILDFSRVEAGKLEIEQIPIYFGDIVSAVMDVALVNAETKNLDMRVQVDKDLNGAVLGDPVRIGQILTNLLSNAIKFTEQGSVGLLIEQTGSSDTHLDLTITVEDSGIGMDEKLAASLFKPFSQADNTTTRRFGGTGLGLAITHQLLTLMSGEISVHSTIGAGSKFVVKLRLKRTEVKPVIEADISVLVGQKVAIIGDSEEGYTLHCNSIQDLECSCETFTLKQFKDVDCQPFDLLLLDLPDRWKDAESLFKDWSKLTSKIGDKPVLILSRLHGPRVPLSKLSALPTCEWIMKPYSTGALAGNLAHFVQTFGIAKDQASTSRDQSKPFADCNFLLVEDNEINYQIANEILTSFGATITWAKHGKEALSILEKQGSNHGKAISYDMILMDLQMPEMDGFETTHIIRADTYYDTTPIVAMTAHAIEEEYQKCLKAGMQDRITKPIDIDTMVKTILKYLKKDTKPASREAEVSEGREMPQDANKDTAEGQSVYHTLPGLNVDHILKMINGKTAMLDLLLRQLVDLIEETETALTPALADGDCKRLAEILHKLKGAAGNMGVKPIFEACRSAEASAKEDDLASVTKTCEELSPLMGEFKTAYHAMKDGPAATNSSGGTSSQTPPPEPAQTSAQAAPTDMGAVMACLEGLTLDLTRNDLSAGDKALELEKLLDQSYSNDIQAISRLIDDLDYPQALRAVMQLTTSLQRKG